MAVIVFASELGSGNGHLGRMLPVAKALVGYGHRVVFAVRHLREACDMLNGERVMVLQAPVCPRPSLTNARPFAAGTYADLLARHGYSCEADLASLLRGWEGLWELIQPDLIVADHAPTACLAARDRIQVAMLGDGFTIPPATGTAFAPLNESATPLVPPGRVEEVIHRVQQRRGCAMPDRLPEMFAVQSRFLTTFAELDPYRGVREEDDWLGPLSRWSAPVASPRTPQIFAYVSSEYPQIVSILIACAEAGVNCSVFFRDGLPADVASLRKKGIEVYDRPQPLADILAGVSAVVHHASLNTTTAALVAGCPQFVLPRHLEQDLTARSLEDLGVGRILGGRLTLKDVGQSLKEFALNKDTAVRSHAFAVELYGRNPRGCLNHVVQRCRQLI